MLIPLLIGIVHLVANGYCNQMQADPYVNCAADAIYVKAKTTETFTGHVSVRFAPDRHCYQVLITNNQIEVLIPHQDCSLARKRLHSPDGVLISAELVVSFHPDFLTKDDRVYKFECLHTRKANESKLEKGAIAKIGNGHKKSEEPHCEYSILSRPGGRLLHSAVIGDIVYHEWKCENAHGNCLLVRNCFFVTPEAKYPLIDSNGCTLDRYVLPDLHYISHRLVGQNVSVFGVAQKPVVFFECELLLNEKGGGACEVPRCESAEKKEDTDGQRTRRSSPSRAIEVQSQRLEISELKNEEADEEFASSPLDMALIECAEPPPNIDRLVCLATPAFVVLSSLMALIVISSGAAATYFVCRKGEYAGVNGSM